MELEITRCEKCNARLAPRTKRRGAPRRFCSDACRLAAYHARNADAVPKHKQMPQTSSMELSPFAQDTLRGADALALYIFGSIAKSRVIYLMSDERKRMYGLYHDGRTICGRKSVIDRVGMQPEQSE